MGRTNEGAPKDGGSCSDLAAEIADELGVGTMPTRPEFDVLERRLGMYRAAARLLQELARRQERGPPEHKGASRPAEDRTCYGMPLNGRDSEELSDGGSPPAHRSIGDPPVSGSDGRNRP